VTISSIIFPTKGGTKEHVSFHTYYAHTCTKLRLLVICIIQPSHFNATIENTNWTTTQF